MPKKKINKTKPKKNLNKSSNGFAIATITTKSLSNAIVNFKKKQTKIKN